MNWYNIAVVEIGTGEVSIKGEMLKVGTKKIIKQAEVLATKKGIDNFIGLTQDPGAAWALSSISMHHLFIGPINRSLVRELREVNAFGGNRKRYHINVVILNRKIPSKVCLLARQ